MAAGKPASDRSSRFMTLDGIAETLNVSAAQAYALVRSGELPAIKVGGRGQWRVETTELENFIQRMYQQTRKFVAEHPLGRGEGGEKLDDPEPARDVDDQVNDDRPELQDKAG